MPHFSNLIRVDKYLKAKPRARAEGFMTGNGEECHIVKRWIPILNGDVVLIEGQPSWCETKAEAIALAVKFRDMCREKFQGEKHA